MNIDTAGGELEMPKKKVGHVHEVSGRGVEKHPVEVEEEQCALDTDTRTVHLD